MPSRAWELVTVAVTISYPLPNKWVANGDNWSAAFSFGSTEDWSPAFDVPVITITCPIELLDIHRQPTRGLSCESFLSYQRWCSLLQPGLRQLLWRRRCNHRARSLIPRIGVGTKHGQYRCFSTHWPQNDAAVFRRRDFAPRVWFNKPIRVAPHPPTPCRPDQKSLQAEATTCRNPDSIRFGVHFCGCQRQPRNIGALL